MRLTAIASILVPIFVVGGILAQSPEAVPPESGSPTTGTPDVTYPPTDAFIFCSAPGCTGTCEVVVSSTVTSDVSQGAPNDMGYQSMYWYSTTNSSGDTLLYTCLNNCLVINPVQIVEVNTCYNLYNNSIPTDFYTYYFL